MAIQHRLLLLRQMRVATVARRRERARCLAESIEVPPMAFASKTGGYLDVGNVRRALYPILTARSRSTRTAIWCPGGNRAAVDRLDDGTQPPRNRMTIQRRRNGRKLLVGPPGIEPGTP